jgi:hypothetical protein
MRHGGTDSDRKQPTGTAGVFRERTVESILSDNDESVSVMMPINQITTSHKMAHNSGNVMRDYANSTNIGQLKKMAQTHYS